MSSGHLEIRVRPATREDIPALVRCATSSTTESEGVGFGRPWSQQTFTDEGRLAAAWHEPNRAGGEEIFVAEVGRRVVGYVTLENRGEILELNNIDVSRDHQRRGIGRQLVRFVEEHARQHGQHAVTLGTSRSAAGVPWKSLRWWQGHGFQITGEEENAWTRSIGAGVREIRMRKDVTVR
ncbi:MAG: GNAT family N-acetyltransferase [Thermoplasmata archaeon]|nr:GNAT family N-acetyltransferase [Thermoplasmata archaeon]